MADRTRTFTPAFRAEAVRRARASGRSRRAVAADLGVGLSTLRNRIDGRRARERDNPPAERQEDMAAELEHLRRHSALGFTSPTPSERGITQQTALHGTGASPVPLRPRSCVARRGERLVAGTQL